MLNFKIAINASDFFRYRPEIWFNLEDIDHVYIEGDVSVHSIRVF